METNVQQAAWNCMHKYVGVTTNTGQSYDGFIAHVDQQHITLAIPSSEMLEQANGMAANGSAYRQFGFYPGFYPRRRFYPMRIPLGVVTGLFLLPFFI